MTGVGGVPVRGSEASHREKIKAERNQFGVISRMYTVLTYCMDD